jgi:hypothetical protein
MHYLLTYLLAIGWSPILFGVFKLSPLIAYMPALFALAFYTFIKHGINERILYLVLILSVFIYIGLLFTQTFSYFIPYFTLPITIYVCYTISKNEKEAINKSIAQLSAIAIIGVILSWIGFFYALNGGQALLYFNNPDGRQNGLFLTTLSNSQYGIVIRPSFIYDEPGALSFALCIVAMLREALGFPRAKTIFILIFGAITFSISHFIVLAIYLTWINKKAALSLAIITAALVTTTMNISELSFFYDRFTVTSDGVSGDNRSAQIENFQKIATPDIIAFGNYKCQERENRMCEEHGDISSSPVTPLYLGGTLLLAVQVIIHMLLIYTAIKCRPLRVSAVCISLLILQRPFFLSYGYQMMILLITSILVSSYDHEYKNKFTDK